MAATGAAAAPSGSGLIDAHVHLAVVGARPEEGYVSPRMLKSVLGAFLRRRWLGVKGLDPEALTRAYRERLEREVAGSRRVKAVVALALDGVYDQDGSLDLERTHLYVPNDAVIALARSSPSFLAGVSVNPHRRDALDELARVAEAGVALVKWLPNAQHIDPADPAFASFYRALADRRLPLLIHSGAEFSVVAGAQQLGDPMRWRAALDQGVDVIAAHAGSSGLLHERGASAFFALLERYPNLHADSSALLMPTRLRMLGKIARAGHLGRLTFGTDYPLPCFPAALLLRLQPGDWLEVRREKNYFDRQVLLFEKLGWEASSAVLERLLARRSGR